MADTLRGIPIEHTWSWIVVVLWPGSEVWMPLSFTVARTRSEAIRLYEGGDTLRGSYARDRRRGTARALQCRIQPCTFGEDRRKALR